MRKNDKIEQFIITDMQPFIISESQEFHSISQVNNSIFSIIQIFQTNLKLYK
jgi:hypothetical protein